MSSESHGGSLTELIPLLRQGDEAAAARVWQRFVPRLLGLARRTLACHPRLAGLADDVVQSVFASFFHRARAGRFTLQGRDDLWNLLAVMTVRKARRTILHETADKRGGGQVRNEAAAPLEEASANLAASTPPASPECDLIAEELLTRLPAELRTVAVLRLMGHTNREIAAQLDWTVRKVERKLQLIRLLWEQDSSEG